MIKKQQDKLVMLTAYDFITAKLLDGLGIDMILVGDSLGNVFAGYKNTLPVTIDQILYHTKAVVTGAPNTMVVSDMPFLSYHISIEETKRHAGLLIKEGGAQAVKMEVTKDNLDMIKAVLDMGIPVMGHIGFTPQTIHKLGGYKVQGRDNKNAEGILSLAKKLEELGCFSLLIEMVAQKITTKITHSVEIPVIGIGAGPDCDGQVLVTQDVLGLTGQAVPKFVKQYANLYDDMKQAITIFKLDVRSNQFPSKEQSYD
jgi:3-methyl-2-oxobutanoate hydroxymethyltransferase